VQQKRPRARKICLDKTLEKIFTGEELIAMISISKLPTDSVNRKTIRDFTLHLEERK
jgi:hypothetical protein